MRVYVFDGNNADSGKDVRKDSIKARRVDFARRVI